jgi:hypothetical protein
MIDQYKQMRVKNQFDMNWFYNYFLSQGGKPISAMNFHMIFSMADINDVLDFLDSKFEITKLVDKNNNIIKIM